MVCSRFKKFPEVFSGDKKVIWDTRQTILSSEKSVVYIKSYLSNEIKNSLLDIEADLYIVDENYTQWAKCIGKKKIKSVSRPEFELSNVAASYFSHPSSRLKCFGVTGTNGKSSVVAILGYLASFSEPVVVIGTLGIEVYKDGKVIDFIDTGFTTPDGPSLHDFLKELCVSKYKYVFMELSSQAKDFGRIEGLYLDVVAFTNLSQDHLDHHKSMENYAFVKAKILTEHLKQGGKIIWPKGGDLRVHSAMKDFESALSEVSTEDFNVSHSGLNGIDFEFDNKKFHSPLIGTFNLENMRIVFESHKALTGELPTVEQVSSVKHPRGRLDSVGKGTRPHVYIDYAHSPDALEKAAKALSCAKENKKQKLWTLFGCGGDRDKSKRPLMAQAAEKYSDKIIVTSDNPRTETPEKIVEEVYSGLLDKEHAIVRVDRREAIRSALEMMSSDDILLIAGKGHEEYQIIGTQKRHFSDYEEVEKYFMGLTKT